MNLLEDLVDIDAVRLLSLGRLLLLVRGLSRSDWLGFLGALVRFSFGRHFVQSICSFRCESLM